ncbi:MAG: Protein translocase subunit SecA [Chlamydiia bacterium]|nr:Protein translocase subunit SecA [Chlamydiia bacterium]
MLKLLPKIFGTAQSRKIGKYSRIVKNINQFEQTLQNLTDEELRAKKEELVTQLKEGASVDSILVPAYALVKNVCRRLKGKEIHVSGYDQKWDMVPFDVQLIGGIAMHYGSIAEMGTGEGKTLTASLPLFLHALTGKGVHLVTVNDYLAERDCQWIGEIFRWFGLSVKALTGSVPVEKRKEVYEADIVYGTASEFGFDYLRDNSMATSASEQVQRQFYFAIVDEIDSILIDEARTPLIISGPTPNSRQMYDDLKSPVALLVRKQVSECKKFASEAEKVFKELGVMEELEAFPKLSKEENAKLENALRSLWIAAQGMPRNEVLMRVRENPDLRAKYEDYETFLHGDANKEERRAALADLFLIIDERANDYELTDKGIEAWAQLPDMHDDDFVLLDLGDEYSKIDQDDLTDQERMKKKTELRETDLQQKEKMHNVRQLLRAHLLMEKDIDYIVADGNIVIIDENTGRPQPGRRFSDGLHQAIEAKEAVKIQQETQTYATITLQNYFRLYKRLAGMTGTAMTEAGEFKEIYNLDVLDVPPNRPNIRKDANDEVYMTEREKFQAILKEVVEIHSRKQPILIGTESVEASEKLSRVLNTARLPHTILNAKNHTKEAEIISQAGQPGAITIATNMAGRGTDIKLGEGQSENGGLAVLATTRHESRRIDNQLRGRSGRQGDPGSSKFFISFEDSLMRLFTSKRITQMLQRFRPPEGEPITAGIIDRSIRTAQKRLEARNYSIRKHTLEYDDVMNLHRTEVYKFRNEILSSKNPIATACDVLDNFASTLTHEYLYDRTSVEGWRPEELSKQIMSHFPITLNDSLFDDDYKPIREFEELVSDKVLASFKEKLQHEAKMIAALQQISGKEMDPKAILCDLIRNLLIKSIDRRWKEHLHLIDNLRSEVGLSTIAQRDPLQEFKHQAFEAFQTFTRKVTEEMAHALFAFEMVLPQSPEVQQAIERAPATAISWELD